MIECVLQRFLFSCRCIIPEVGYLAFNFERLAAGPFLSAARSDGRTADVADVRLCPACGRARQEAVPGERPSSPAGRPWPPFGDVS